MLRKLLVAIGLVWLVNKLRGGSGDSADTE
jgi:hypothetical protein